jgi:peroxiredoxin
MSSPGQAIRLLTWTMPNAADSGKWLVPIPATYLVDRTRRIAMAAIDTDYRNRLEHS